MEVYKHPDMPNWVLAKRRNVRIEIERSRLSADPAVARVELESMIDSVESDAIGPDGLPVQPSVEMEPDRDLDPERADFDDWLEGLSDELQYLDGIISTIDSMTLAELRTAFKRSEKRDRQILRALKYIARVIIFLAGDKKGFF